MNERRFLVSFAVVALGVAGCLSPLSRAISQPQQEWEFVELSIETDLVPSPVSVGVLLPPGYSSDSEPFPLLLALHGGVRDEERAAVAHRQLNGGLRQAIEAASSAGELANVVAVMPATGRSFYLDYQDGSQLWETFVIDELLPDIRQRFNITQGRAGSLVWGFSMGGMGALRYSFKYPNEFEAAAAMAPGIEPVLEFEDIDQDDPLRLARAGDYEEKYGRPVDRAYWHDNHLLNIATEEIDSIRGAGLQIYLEVGDEDEFGLLRGSEMLHRVLYDAGIQHEYRIVRGGRHGGPTIPGRIMNSLQFLGRVLESVPPDEGQ